MKYLNNFPPEKSMQFQGKRMIQTQENGEKPHFGFDLVPWRPNSGRHFFSKIWLRRH